MVEDGIEAEGMGVSLCEARDPTEDFVPHENPEGTPVTKAIRKVLERALHL